MAKRTGLGRGLGSLISGGVDSEKASVPQKNADKKAGKKKSSSKKKKGISANKPARSKPASAPATSREPLPEGTRAFPMRKPAKSPQAQTPSPTGLLEIPIDRVAPNPHQPRKDFQEAGLQELADSILSEGLLQPVVVRRKGENTFELIAGERRWRACRLLKLKGIPARVIEASETSSAVLSLIENLQREDLNPIEEALGYASLMKDFDLTQEQVSERVGRSRASIANSLRMLQLGREIQGYLVKGHISVGHAKVLLGVEDAETRLLLSRQCIERGWSVRELERQLQGSHRTGDRSGKIRAGTSAAEQSAIEDLQKQLSTSLSTRVVLKHTPRKGRIVIEYHGNDDLQRIIETMGIR